MVTQIVPTRATVLGEPRVRRFTVEQYHRMIETGILDEGSREQLLDGVIFTMAAHGSEHVVAVKVCDAALRRILPPQWHLQIQDAITLDTSEPEPDLALVRGSPRDYLKHLPTASSVGLLVEISDSSLRTDRNLKTRIYANARIPVYWIVNLIDRQVEVQSDLHSAGPRRRPRYRLRQIFSERDRIPVFLDGQQIGEIAVADLLP